MLRLHNDAIFTHLGQIVPIRIEENGGVPGFQVEHHNGGDYVFAATVPDGPEVRPVHY